MSKGFQTACVSKVCPNSLSSNIFLREFGGRDYEYAADSTFVPSRSVTATLTLGAAMEVEIAARNAAGQSRPFSGMNYALVRM